MSHTIAVGEFEGPLGVLLELVERNKLEVSAISVGQITSEYLAYVRSLTRGSAEDLSEFLQLGARLLYIKSLALLPQDSAEQQASELQQLSLELAEYRRFQEAARNLGALATQATWPRPVVTRLDPGELPLPDIQLTQLAEAFTQALRRTQKPTLTTIQTPHLSLETVTRRLHKLLPGGFNLQTVIDSCNNRLEIVVTFLATLELVRSGAAKLTQASQFEPILVEPLHA
jgi:segregation and condensation protein A